MSNKGRKVRFRKDVSFQKLAGQFIEPDDLKDAKPGAFSVYRYSHKKGTFVNQGMIIKTQNQKAEGSYIFCSKKNFNLFMKNIGLHSYIALHKVEFERKKEILRMIWDRSLKKYYANRPKDGMVRPAIRAEVRPK